MTNFPRWQAEKETRRSKKKQPRKNPRLGTLAHELLNQLSVIQLACFSLRQQSAKGVALNLGNLETIETAVLEAAERANTICTRLDKSKGDENAVRPEPVSAAPGQKTNVYPFPTQLPGRKK